MSRRFCITEHGRFGLVLPLAQKGDRVCRVLGTKAPLIIREVNHTESDAKRFSLVGDCYVDRLMGSGSLKAEDFEEVIFE